MRFLSGLGAVLFIAAGTGGAAQAQNIPLNAVAREDYVKTPMPPGFQVINSDIEGPVFADARGKTLYVWPVTSLRNGEAGEQKNKPTCDNTLQTETAGLMSPYPAGLILPDIDIRHTCAQEWPPVLAANDAKPVGDFTIVVRKDGTKQWAYKELALYTSFLDKKPGDTWGGTRFLTAEGERGALRLPVGPQADAPPQFVVYPVARGRVLTTAVGHSVYTSDNDGKNASKCYGACLLEWAPMIAPETAVPQGAWSVFERAPGVKQWAYRGKPLYTRVGERRFRSYEGGDQPGWRNVFTHLPAPFPDAFKVQDTHTGEVVADARGHTVYIYYCNDDASDQLACSHPDASQAYRFAVCGGGDAARCQQTFPYVMAEKGAQSKSPAWSILYINQKTGRRAQETDPDALRVWAFRDRPVFTHVRDLEPGDVNGDGWGEFNGFRNGFKAFWLREDFLENAG